jgi:pyruvate dehydrogenase E2 component (dihydrolipoamide acetyltransferase)
MTLARQTVPDFAVRRSVDLTRALAWRDRCCSEANQTGQRRPSVNDLVVAAAAAALREHPLANASYRDDVIELHRHVNVGVAVDADDLLLVPTVFDADTKSVLSLASELGELVRRARARQVAPHELEDGTFTVTNLGMLGIDDFVPIINPPQAAILGVGRLQRSASSSPPHRSRCRLTLTLACDHRVLYGAGAARFVASICDRLETPGLLDWGEPEPMNPGR